MGMTAASTRLFGTISIMFLCQDRGWRLYKLEDDVKPYFPVFEVDQEHWGKTFATFEEGVDFFRNQYGTKTPR
jgi:hypothetical protein